MAVDLLISAPVAAFLIWLYWYSAPVAAPRWQCWLDRLILVASPLALIGIIVLGHLRIDYPGTGLNVMLVAAAYLVVLGILGSGWLVRFLRRD